MAVVLLGATLAAGCQKNAIEVEKGERITLRATLEQPVTKTGFIGTTTNGEGQTEFIQAWSGNEIMFVYRAIKEPNENSNNEWSSDAIAATHSSHNDGHVGTESVLFDQVTTIPQEFFGTDTGTTYKIFAGLSGETDGTISGENDSTVGFGAWSTNLVKYPQDGTKYHDKLNETNPIDISHITGKDNDKFYWDYMYKSTTTSATGKAATKLNQTQNYRGTALTNFSNSSDPTMYGYQTFAYRNLICEGAMLKGAVLTYKPDGTDNVNLNFKFYNIVSVIRIPLKSTNGTSQLAEVKLETRNGAATSGENDHCAGAFKIMIQKPKESNSYQPQYAIFPYNSTAGTSTISGSFSNFGYVNNEITSGEDEFVTLDGTETYICFCVFPRVYKCNDSGVSMKFSYKMVGDNTFTTKSIKTDLDLSEVAVYTFAPIDVNPASAPEQ